MRQPACVKHGLLVDSAEEVMMVAADILLVEDNSDDEKMTLRALAKAQPPPIVHVVRDGPAALEYLFGEQRHPIPHLILLDIKLPMLSGLDLLEKLRAEEVTQHVPVVVLTSSDETPDIQKAYALGANSYICKPVDYEKYIRVVELLGIYWMQANRGPNGSLS